MSVVREIVWHERVPNVTPAIERVRLACGHEREILHRDLLVRERNRALWLICWACDRELSSGVQALWERPASASHLREVPPIPNAAAAAAAGLRPERVRFGWWLVASGRVSDWPREAPAGE